MSARVSRCFPICRAHPCQALIARRPPCRCRCTPRSAIPRSTGLPGPSGGPLMDEVTQIMHALAYLSVFAAAAVEGETVFVIASVAVATGSLNYWGVLV